MLTKDELQKLKEILARIIHSYQQDGKWYADKKAKIILVQVSSDDNSENILRIRIEQPSDFKKIFFNSEMFIHNSHINYITENVTYTYNKTAIDKPVTILAQRPSDFNPIPLSVKKAMSLQQDTIQQYVYVFDCLIIETKEDLKKVIDVINNEFLKRGGEEKDKFVLSQPEGQKKENISILPKNIAAIVGGTGFEANLITVKKESTAEKLLLFIKKPKSEFSKEIAQSNIKKAINKENLNSYHVLCTPTKRPCEGFNIIIVGDALSGICDIIKRQQSENPLQPKEQKIEKPESKINATSVSSSLYYSKNKSEETEPLIEQKKERGCCFW